MIHRTWHIWNGHLIYISEAHNVKTACVLDSIQFFYNDFARLWHWRVKLYWSSVNLSLCHCEGQIFSQIDAFTSKTQGFFDKTFGETKDLWISYKYTNTKIHNYKTQSLFAKNIWRDKGLVDFMRDPHISTLPPSNLHNGADVKIWLPSMATKICRINCIWL